MHIRSGPPFLQAQRCGALFPSAPLIRAAFPKPVTQNPAGLPSGIKDCVHRAIAQTPAVRGQGFANLQQGSLKWPYLLGGGLMLLGVSGAKVHAESQTVSLVEGRMKSLLNIDEKERTVGERLELYRCILALGQERVEQAKGKDITVVYGKTEAGKSVLINYVYGCDMAKDESGRVIVDPKSKENEVALIGHGGEARTAVPQLIPEITFGFGNQQECKLNLCDIAGLCDNRGVEVVIANAVLLKELVKQAKSVRFVLVFDIRGLEGRGKSWVEVAQLLHDTFRGVVGEGEDNLRVIFTRSQNLEQEKMSIQALKKGKISGRLSEFAITYDPLDPKERNNLRLKIFNTESHKNVDVRVRLGDEQYHQAKKLGEEIGGDVEGDLKDEKTWPAALPKLQFTYGLANLGDLDLKAPHEKVSEPILRLGASLTRELDPQISNADLGGNHHGILDRYMRLRGTFGFYVSFDDKDYQIKNVTQKFKDERVSWSLRSVGSGVGGVVSGGVALVGGNTAVGGAVANLLGVGAGTVALPTVAVATAAGVAVVGGGAAIYYGYRWVFPSEEDKKLARFFDW